MSSSLTGLPTPEGPGSGLRGTKPPRRVLAALTAFLPAILGQAIRRMRG
jgi:hypothetical protein